MVLIVMLVVYFVNSFVWFVVTTNEIELETWLRTYAAIGVAVFTMGVVLVRGLQKVRDVNNSRHVSYH
jgi:hypothetical protein